jgi:hypothetical protein
MLSSSTKVKQIITELKVNRDNIACIKRAIWVNDGLEKVIKVINI